MAEAKPIPNQKLRYERERRGWSQQDVADKVGTTPLNVGRWERGVTMPSPYYRQKLCEIFEKTPQELGLVHEAVTETLIADPVSPSSTVLPQEAPALLWNVPYNRNPLFTGREETLTQIRLALTSDEQPLALTQPQAISGLGGIGKTQTAVEYAHRYRDDYAAVFWVRADSADLLSSDYLTIAALLALPERNEQDQSLVVKAVLRWFDTHEGWLLILDNADDLETISGFIPSAGKGHVLLTTRSHSTGTIAGRIELDTMGLEEGMFLLLRRAKLLKGSSLSVQAVPETARSQAQVIVEAVDGLPLALDQAGAYIESTGCNLSDYLKFYKTRRHRLLRMRGESATGHPEPVATTWSLSFEKVERANPAAAELLRLCAFLHPDEIPESMIIEGASELGPLLQSVAEDEMELNEAIGELRKYSLVKRDPELKILNLHRLVQAVIRDGIDEQTQRAWAERVVRMVSRVLPDSKEASLWPEWQQYLPHLQICVELIREWKMTSRAVVHLLNHTGRYFLERGQYAEAELFLLDALTIQGQTVGAESASLAEVLSNLALLYWLQGKYEQSESFFLRAIALQEQALEGESSASALAEMVNDLGMLYSTQGKYPQAESLFLRAITIWQDVLKPDDPILAYGLHNLASLYDDLGKYAEAEKLYSRSLAIREKSLGPEHFVVASSLNNLAVLYRNMGRYADAEPLLKRALAIIEKVLGKESLRRAASLDNLAQNYRDQGEYEQAEWYFQQALTLRRKGLGAEHPDLAFSLQGLAILYRLQGKYQQAEPLFQEALVLREKALGLDHHSVAWTLNELALLYCEQDKYDEAELLFERALTIRQTRLGEDHPETIATMEKYATLLRKAGRIAEAVSLEEHAQAIRAKHER